MAYLIEKIEKNANLEVRSSLFTSSRKVKRKIHKYYLQIIELSESYKINH